MITREQLVAIMPHAARRADLWLSPLNEAMTEFGIDTQRRVTAFLAQVAHESDELRNTVDPDGSDQRYKSRGLLSITGQHNYRQASIALYGDPDMLLAHPELLEDPIPAARAAAWFWWVHGLNVLADCPNSFQAITNRINGSLNGYAARVAYFETAKRTIEAVYDALSDAAESQAAATKTMIEAMPR